MVVVGEELCKMGACSTSGAARPSCTAGAHRLTRLRDVCATWPSRNNIRMTTTVKFALVSAPAGVASKTVNQSVTDVAVRSR